MFDRLKLIEKQYKDIQDKLSTGTLEVNEMTELLKESAGIQETVETYQLYQEKESELNDLKEMLEIEEDDEDLIQMAEKRN